MNYNVKAGRVNVKVQNAMVQVLDYIIASTGRMMSAVIDNTYI